MLWKAKPQGHFMMTSYGARGIDQQKRYNVVGPPRPAQTPLRAL